MTEKQRIAYARVRSMDKDMLVPADVADILGIAAVSISAQARKDPAMIGFPVMVVGTRTYIPKHSFLKFCADVMGYGK